MLFIIYGGTLELGFKSREYFQKRGFNIIKKYNFITNLSTINSKQYKKPIGVYKDWFNDKVYVNETEIEKLDFQYEQFGIRLGFDKKQIVSSVHGVLDSVITLSASSIEFIRHLKKAYGEYVTTIYLQVSIESVRTLLANQPNISTEEFNSRFQGHIRTQQVYLDNLDLFDYNIIYEKSPSHFNLDAVYKQYKHIIKERKAVEHLLNNKNYVELPYTGKEPYAFVSYKHEDKDQVYPVLYMLQRNGLRIWYDDGIEGGQNWQQIISQKLEDSSLFILFSSKMAVKSENVLDEIFVAFHSLNKNCITIRLDNATFDHIIEARIIRHQTLSICDSEFDFKLINAISAQAPELFSK